MENEVNLADAFSSFTTCSKMFGQLARALQNVDHVLALLALEGLYRIEFEHLRKRRFMKEGDSVENFRTLLRLWRCESPMRDSYADKCVDEILKRLTIFQKLSVPVFIGDFGRKRIPCHYGEEDMEDIFVNKDSLLLSCEDYRGYGLSFNTNMEGRWYTLLSERPIGDYNLTSHLNNEDNDDKDDAMLVKNDDNTDNNVDIKDGKSDEHGKNRPVTAQTLSDLRISNLCQGEIIMMHFCDYDNKDNKDRGDKGNVHVYVILYATNDNNTNGGGSFRPLKKPSLAALKREYNCNSDCRLEVVIFVPGPCVLEESDRFTGSKKRKFEFIEHFDCKRTRRIEQINETTGEAADNDDQDPCPIGTSSLSLVVQPEITPSSESVSIEPFVVSPFVSQYQSLSHPMESSKDVRTAKSLYCRSNVTITTADTATLNDGGGSCDPSHYEKLSNKSSHTLTLFTEAVTVTSNLGSSDSGRDESDRECEPNRGCIESEASQSGFDLVQAFTSSTGQKAFIEQLTTALAEIDRTIGLLVLEGLYRIDKDLGQIHDPEVTSQLTRLPTESWRDGNGLNVIGGIKKLLYQWVSNFSSGSAPNIWWELRNCLMVYQTLHVPMFVDRARKRFNVTVRGLDSYSPYQMEDINVDGETIIYHVTHKEEAENISAEKNLKGSNRRNAIKGIWFGIGFRNNSESIFGSKCFKTKLSLLGVTGLYQGEIVYYNLGQRNVILYATDNSGVDFKGLKKPTMRLLQSEANELHERRRHPWVMVSIFVPERFLPSANNFGNVISEADDVRHTPVCIKIGSGDKRSCAELVR